MAAQELPHIPHISPNPWTPLPPPQAPPRLPFSFARNIAISSWQLLTFISVMPTSHATSSGWRPGLRLTSHNAQDSPSQQRITHLQMSVVLSLRN